jgi:hypothetical protein
MGKRAWAKLIYENRRTLYALVREGAGKFRNSRRSQKVKLTAAPPV